MRIRGGVTFELYLSVHARSSSGIAVVVNVVVMSMKRYAHAVNSLIKISALRDM